MFRTYTAIQFICFMLLCVLSSQSSAIMEGISTEDLTKASDVVIEGEVIDSKADWSNDGKTIFTKAIISESMILKGRITQTEIIVEYDGGVIGDIGLKVSDVTPLIKGEKVILFLKAGKSKKDGSVFNIVGKGQGKYTIGSDNIARKGGFSIISGEELIDDNIHVDFLVDKIRRAK